MSTSTTSTIAMNGRSTAYGMSTGNEVFNLNGYDNTVLMGGAADTVNILGGQFDCIDLNTTGFTGATADVINLGASAFDQVISSQALYNSNVSITASGGPETVSMVNHGGQTNVTLGNVGDTNLQGRAYGNIVKLNGDATNSVDLTSGGNAFVTIGAAGDAMTGYSSSVSVVGVQNTIQGGDESFNLQNATSIENTITLGNGSDHVSIAGARNTIALGNGADTLAVSGSGNVATLGSGADVVSVGGGSATLTFAAGNAGVADRVTMSNSYAQIHGGNENFTITSATHKAFLGASLGDGNNTIDLAYGNARLIVGTDVGNTGHNSVTLAHGGATATFNGGVDTITLGGSHAVGADHVTLNATLLGTSLNTSGMFNNVNLTQDANAAITDTGVNAGLLITLNADSTGGFGNISIDGLAHDDLAQIQLVSASAYSVTADNTAAGGVTLHFDHGSIDLVGLQSVPTHLFGG